MIELRHGETIVTELRRHWYVIFAESFFLIIFVIAPLILLGTVNITSVILLPGVIPLFIFASAVWLLFVWVAFFIIWTNYYLDVWIITTKRIIDIEQHYLFSREMSEFNLDKIQDITVEVRGFIATLLHFGNINVQTAGTQKHFTIRHVPHPEKAKDLIFKLHNELMGEMSEKAE